MPATTKTLSRMTRRLHTLLALLRINDDTYREMLHQQYKVTSSKELTERQQKDFVQLLEELAVKAGVWNRLTPGKPEVAKQGTLSTLRFYIIRCAIEYCELGVYSTPTGLLSGDALRDWIRRHFAVGALKRGTDRRHHLPAALVETLYRDWINPTLNRWLVEKGLRTGVRDEHKLYFDRLRQVEAQHLLDRARAMMRTIEERETPPPPAAVTVEFPCPPSVN